MASAKGQRMATMYNIGLLGQNQQQGEQNLRQTSGQALDELGQGYGQAVNYAQHYGNQALGSLGQARGELQSGYGQAREALNQGRNEAQSRLDTVNGLYQPYAAAGAWGVDALRGSLAGDNSQFKASDNYKFTLDEAMRAGTRQASAMGRLDGGGTLAALSDRAAGLASGELRGWQDRLQGLTNTGMQANAAIGANTTNQANLDWAQGQGQSSLWAGEGRDLASNATQQAGVYSGLGGQLGNYAFGTGAAKAGVYSNLGNSLANLGTQTTNAMTGQVSNAAAASAAAKNANQNLMLGLGGQILGLGLGGGKTVGGSLLSGLGSMFTGGA